jgi:aquaporin-4
MTDLEMGRTAMNEPVHTNNPPIIHATPPAPLISIDAASYLEKPDVSTNHHANEPAASPTSPHLERTFAGAIVRVWKPRSKPLTLSDCIGYLGNHYRCFVNDLQHTDGWKKRLQLSLFRDITLYHAALIEFIGTFMLTFMVITFCSGILAHAQDYSYFPTAIAIVHIPLAFIILATGSSSGGHLNPMISFATMVAGMTEFPRMVVYIIAQIVGSIGASYTAKHMLPESTLHAGMLAMCSLGTEQTVHQALTMEIFCDFFVLFVAFGVALDERQRQVFAPWLPPFIIGTLIALLIYTTSTISPMSNGAIAYPTRCFGPAVAMGLVTADSFTLGNGTVVRNAQWIYWIGPLISALMIGSLYRISPPGYQIIVAEKKKVDHP